MNETSEADDDNRKDQRQQPRLGLLVSGPEYREENMKHETQPETDTLTQAPARLCRNCPHHPERSEWFVWLSHSSVGCHHPLQDCPCSVSLFTIVISEIGEMRMMVVLVLVLVVY